MKVTARAERSGGWWAVEVLETPGVFTQAKRLDQVAAMVRDAVALMADVVASSVEVTVAPEIPSEVREYIESSRRDRLEAERVQARAAASIRAAAASLVADGYSVRDVALVLGVSHQRVSQLLKAGAPISPVTLDVSGTTPADAPVSSGRSVGGSAAITGR